MKKVVSKISNKIVFKTQLKIYMKIERKLTNVTNEKMWIANKYMKC